MGKYFGTDGFRGEANVTLTVEDAYKVGRFLGWYYGKKKPEESGSWTCSCGQVNTGNFCANCGKKRPDSVWTCSCGQENKGNFCANCGKPRQ